MAFNHHEYSIRGEISAQSGIFEIENIRKSYERHYLNIVFFSDADYTTGVATSSMGGSVEFTATDNRLEYGGISDGTVTLGTTTYPRPNLQGSIDAVRVDLSGITSANGATHFIAYLNSFGSE